MRYLKKIVFKYENTLPERMCDEDLRFRLYCSDEEPVIVDAKSTSLLHSVDNEHWTGIYR